MNKSKPENSSLNARKVAAFALKNVMNQQQSLDIFFSSDTEFLSLNKQDRAFCQRITRTTLRHYGAIEASYKPYFTKPVPPGKYLALAHIYLATAQIAFEKIPPYAAIDSAVELVKRHAKGYEKLANATLRRWLKEHGEQFKENPNHNIPQWLMQKWLGHYGGDINEITQNLMGTPPLDLSFKSSDARGRFLEALGGGATQLGKSARSQAKKAVTELPEYEAGHWWVQDIAASLPIYLLGDVKDKSVLDMCAAPGGKAMQLAAQGARVTALDTQTKRLDIIRENLTRTGLQADLHEANALKWPEEQQYDAILLDAPCSATGTLRRNPDIKYIRTAKNLLNAVSLQKKLLNKALTLLKPGGRLVYCVCSMEPEEGEELIQALLNEHKGVKLAYDLALLPIDVLDSGGLGLRTHPGLLSEHGGMDGFFMTCIEKP